MPILELHVHVYAGNFYVLHFVAESMFLGSCQYNLYFSLKFRKAQLIRCIKMVHRVVDSTQASG